MVLWLIEKCNLIQRIEYTGYGIKLYLIDLFIKGGKHNEENHTYHWLLKYNFG